MEQIPSTGPSPTSLPSVQFPSAPLPPPAPLQQCSGICDNRFCQDVLMRYNSLIAQLSAGLQSHTRPLLQGQTATMFLLPPPAPSHFGRLPNLPGIFPERLSLGVPSVSSANNVATWWTSSSPTEPSIPAVADPVPLAAQDAVSMEGLEKNPEVTKQDTNDDDLVIVVDDEENAPSGDVKSSDNAEADTKCKWATCTAEFRTVDELLPHISKLHLSANRVGHPAKRPRPDRASPALSTVGSDMATEDAMSNAQDADDTASISDDGVSVVDSTAGSSSARATFFHACKWALCSLSSFFSVDDLIQHLCSDHLAISKGNMRPHGCLWLGCAHRFETFDELTDHVSEDHIGSGQHEYVCMWENCDRNGKPFNQRQKVMRHIQTHTGDKPYQCTVCNQRFSESGIMTQHMRTHTGERPYKCPEPTCERQFAIPGALTIHIRKHTGEKPFKCKMDGCDKRFAESSNLTKHLRVHTGEKPFRCPMQQCTKKFARPDQVARHRRIHEKKN
ncbi:uncharacterized protein SPPG_06111 [Spizellomyces punctatus DAOM BR117]|uniref:C2H2-type domain-containing protein n=1 Tax=Spizellomyces punctatus (strain DAOM BR117) TaxID=645134 RepID=A0A0L0HB17_SPIPD|nr:uncharacterized protein SPPG_06111 [Spizellomyces punctatus DAOM BR117]KNC98407.1 hypothetical protein SPPG_06111 [Spizellomyces punctatus DAOM BR117]|eukprot:XP_016606447.1 hypothetical protein SPPG_06111 [Spizellomyces punctatus DAOM BR117]